METAEKKRQRPWGCVGKGRSSRGRACKIGWTPSLLFSASLLFVPPADSIPYMFFFLIISARLFPILGSPKLSPSAASPAPSKQQLSCGGRAAGALLLGKLGVSAGHLHAVPICSPGGQLQSRRISSSLFCRRNWAGSFRAGAALWGLQDNGEK